jgi:2,3-dihydro-2,3-dihydroxybenzoate dehydrogenase
MSTITAGDFAGKVALVTGASGGIGAAVARALAAQGATVAAADRDADRLAGLVDRLGREGLRVSAHPVDVTSSAAVDALVDRVEREVGAIDCLVNVAGVLRPGAVVTTTDEDWAATFAVNTTGVFHTSRAVAARMVDRRAGAIVTVASNAAAVPRTGMGAYAASKAAATAFTKCLALEVARHGVRCNVVAPGSTDTPMLRSLWTGGNDDRHTLDGRLDQFRVGIPLGKIARPEDVAEAVLFLLSERAGHITMQDLYVDGGAALGV